MDRAWGAYYYTGGIYVDISSLTSAPATSLINTEINVALAANTSANITSKTDDTFYVVTNSTQSTMPVSDGTSIVSTTESVAGIISNDEYDAFFSYFGLTAYSYQSANSTQLSGNMANIITYSQSASSVSVTATKAGTFTIFSGNTYTQKECNSGDTVYSSSASNNPVLIVYNI